MFRQLVRNRALLTFMLGHFTVDMFGGLLPVLYPLMATAFGLSLADVGWIALCFTGASSLSQPFFGFAADRYGSRYLAPASIVWASVMFGIVGFSPNVLILAISAAMAGLGSGAYHPQGAANASAVTGDLQKNTAMSLYTFGGSAGYSLGPILGGAILFGLVGRRGTVALVPFGIIAAWLIFQSFKRLGLGLPEAHHESHSVPASIRWRPLTPIMGVSMLRNMVSLSVLTFVPLWYHDMGYSVRFYGTLTSSIIIGSAFGTVCGGLLADRFGQRRVLIIEMALAVPALAIFMLNPGYGGFLLGPLYGFICDGPASVTLVMAQRLLPGRVGMASGFVLGLSFVAAGIGAPLTGSLADRIGTPHALMIVSLLMLAAIAIVPFIPREALQVREAPPPPPLLAPAVDD
jgi:FSR family fosmidomycin resistance protein-like MFS transporter